jgi:hypothetical protein
MAVTQVLSLLSKHRRRKRAGQGGKAADNTQKTSFGGFFRGRQRFIASVFPGNAA